MFEFRDNLQSVIIINHGKLEAFVLWIVKICVI